MTKEKYNTKDIKHIDEKSQEYIAKGNRMTEVLNCDYFNRNRGFNCYKGYNCTDKECYDCYYRQLKRLEQKYKELKKAYDEISNNSEILHENNCLRIANAKLSEDLWQHGISMREWREQALNYRSALEEIIDMFLNQVAWVGQLTNFEEEIYNKINEVLK